MAITRAQTIPQDWDEARDIPFFRVTAGLFSPAFCFGAGVLLAGNDDADAPELSVEPRTSRALCVTAGTVPATFRG
jgi:hypothetical protein